MGRMIAYARVSTGEQKVGMQVDALLAAGVAREDIFLDEGVSGTKRTRPGLDACLAALQPGDVLVVYRIDRLGRLAGFLLTVLDDLQARGIGFRSLSEGIDTTTAMGRMVFGILAAVAQGEREVTVERIKGGIASFRKDLGRWGRRRALLPHQVERARKMMDEEGCSLGEVARTFNVSKSSVWRALRR